MRESRPPRRLNVSVNLDARKAATALAWVVVILLAVHAVGQFCIFYLDIRLPGVVSLFDVGAEANIPTLYSSATLLCCSVLLALIASAKSGEPRNESRRWYGLAWIFGFLAADEAFVLHERLIAPVRSLINLPAILHYAWVIPYGIFAGLVLAIYLGFIRRLPPDTRRLFLLAGGIYVSGALGFELIEGLYADRFGGKLFAALIAAEECLEMFGVVVFIYALLSYLESEMKMTAVDVSLRLNAPSA